MTEQLSRRSVDKLLYRNKDKQYYYKLCFNYNPFSPIFQLQQSVTLHVIVICILLYSQHFTTHTYLSIISVISKTIKIELCHKVLYYSSDLFNRSILPKDSPHNLGGSSGLGHWWYDDHYSVTRQNRVSRQKSERAATIVLLLLLSGPSHLLWFF